MWYYMRHGIKNPPQERVEMIPQINLPQKQTNENVTFYHVSTAVEAFKSFFREGAKPVGKGFGGQSDGFYVWTSEAAAEDHIRFLKDGAWAYKELEGDEALIIGVTIPKSTISYPDWQQDMEHNRGLIQLAFNYSDVLNEKAHHLNIPLPKEKRPFGWFFKTITGISVRNCFRQDALLFEGVDDTGKVSHKIFMNTPPWDSDDSVKFQILTDWLCQNSPRFKEDYNRLMHHLISQTKEFTALKYTGLKPLTITSAKYVKVNEDGSFIKSDFFNAPRKEQVCPFLTLAALRRGRTP